MIGNALSLSATRIGECYFGGIENCGLTSELSALPAYDWTDQ